jgi:hypothetical protein
MASYQLASFRKVADVRRRARQRLAHLPNRLDVVHDEVRARDALIA